MNIVNCLNCGKEFLLERTYADELGIHTICPHCGASFDTDGEVELDDSQQHRREEVYEAACSLCRVLIEDESMGRDMTCLEEIVGFAAAEMLLAGKTVRFPMVVTKPDGSQHIREYYEPGEAY